MPENKEFVQWILELIEDNDANDPITTWERNYNEGYHDALVDVLNHLGVEHDKEYYI